MSNLSNLGKRPRDNFKGGEKRQRSDDYTFSKTYSQNDMDRMKMQMNHNFAIIIQNKNVQIDELKNKLNMTPNHRRMIEEEANNKLIKIQKIIQQIDNDYNLHIMDEINRRLNNV